MITNGWVICVDNGDFTENNVKYRNKCEQPGYGKNQFGFWGYTYGCKIGSIKAQFEGSGTGALNFGSCHTAGTIKVFLNNVLIKTACSEYPTCSSEEFAQFSVKSPLSTHITHPFVIITAFHF